MQASRITIGLSTLGDVARRVWSGGIYANAHRGLGWCSVRRRCGRLTEDQLYGAQAAALMDRLRQIPGVVGSVLISGHNPRRAICHPASINTPSKPSRRQNAPRGRR